MPRPPRLLPVLLTILFLFYAGIANGSSSTKKKECEKLNDKIAKIQKKMRNGYTAKQGVKYHKQLNKLYKKQFEACF